MEKSNAKIGDFKLVARTARGRLKNISKKPTSLSVNRVIAAFGGKSAPVKAGNVKDPITLLAIREALVDRLRSTGGRPSLTGDSLRQRVQISAKDWKKITTIASHFEVGRHKPSPAQVASILIHFALEHASPSAIDQLMHTDIENQDTSKAERQRTSARD
jgi:hypothetical protein